MSTEHTQADALILAIEQASLQRAQRVGEEAALVQQVADLEALVRNLCDKLAETRGAVECQNEHAKTQRGTIAEQRGAIDMLNGTVRRQREQIRLISLRAWAVSISSPPKLTASAPLPRPRSPGGSSAGSPLRPCCLGCWTAAQAGRSRSWPGRRWPAAGALPRGHGWPAG